MIIFLFYSTTSQPHRPYLPWRTPCCCHFVAWCQQYNNIDYYSERFFTCKANKHVFWHLILYCPFWAVYPYCRPTVNRGRPNKELQPVLDTQYIGWKTHIMYRYQFQFTIYFFFFTFLTNMDSCMPRRAMALTHKLVQFIASNIWIKEDLLYMLHSVMAL